MADTIRQIRVIEVTFYRWRKEYGGLADQRQTYRTAVGTGGAQGPNETTEEELAMVQRWILHPSTAGAPQSCLVIRLCP